MCDVAAVVGLAIAAGSAAAESDQARRTRNRAERFRKRQEMLEKAHALQAERIATQEIHQQQIADADAAALEIEGNRREAQAAISTTKVVAGEAGAFGLSYEGLIGEFSRAQAEFEQAIDTNLAIKNQFAMLNLESTALGTRARIANAQTPSLPRPNYANIMIRGLGSGFQIGSSARAAGVNEVFS